MSDRLSTVELFLALGSNLGDRERNIRLGVEALERLEGFRLLRKSSVYESPPSEGASGTDYLNIVVMGKYSGEPGLLLDETERIEAEHGRNVKGLNAPRTLDIDILFFGDRIIETDRLTVPHPALYRRAFVLVPLNEIASGFRCPKTGKTVSDLLDSLNTEQVLKKL